MKHFTLLPLFIVIFAVSYSSIFASDKSSAPFTYHLQKEPHNLDPTQQRSLLGGYFFTHLSQSLLRYSKGKLIFESAENCTWKTPLKYRCQLRKGLKWSNGEPLTAQHFADTYKRLFSENTKSLATEHLVNLENARVLLKNPKSKQQLGVKAINKSIIEFSLMRRDSDFPYKIAHPAFGPSYAYKEKSFPKKKKAPEIVTNGPYKIKQWRLGHFVELERNPYYWRNEKRPYPNVKIYFIEEDSTALTMYEAKRINFLRRIPSSLIPGYQKQADFLQVPMARFDYIGFGPRFKDKPNLRKALVRALNYKKLQEIYRAKGRPGCPALPRAYMDKLVCHSFNKSRAKSFYKKSKPLEKAFLKFSKMGGDDIQKGMEWMQAQWKQNLGFNVTLESIEQGHFLNTIRYKTPDLFRKGIPLDRPSCLAGVENFVTGHPENYIKLSDKIYDQRVAQLRRERVAKRWPKLCRLAVERLIELAVVIPLGEIHFTMLNDNRFSGFYINEMNQVDLTELNWAK